MPALPRSSLWLIVLASATLAASETATTGVHLTVPYSAPGQGFLSLALYDQAGTLVRSLLSAEAVSAGAGTVSWDATSDLGVGVPPGSYTAKGVFFTEPPSLSWVMKVGKDGNPPWRTANGGGDWGGNLGGPAGLCASATSMVLVWGCVEDNQITGVQQMDADGAISLRYHTFYPWDQRSAAAMDERNLYVAILKDCAELQIAAYTLGDPRGRILAKLPAAMATTGSGRWRGRGANVVDGIALTPTRLFASVGTNDVVYIIDRANGSIVRTMAVPGARGLAISQDRLLVGSGEQVLRYTLAGEPDGVAVAKGTLQAAHTVCVGSDGTIWVGDSGRFDPDAEKASGSRRIYAFSPSGELKRTIGKAGGAPRSGIFDPSAIGDIHGMCLTPAGTALMVNDTATGFSRTSRWSLDGKLERQWFVRGNENWPDALNPARPEETVKVGGPFADDMTAQAWHIDFEHKTWQPAWRYTMPYAANWQDDVVIGFGHGGNPLKKEAGHPGTWATFGWGAEGGLCSWKGRNYMLSSEGAIYTYAPDQAPKLVAMVFTHRCEAGPAVIKELYDQGPNCWFCWADRDGDGKVQRSEITVTTGVALLENSMRMHSCTLDANLDILLTALTRTDPATGACTREFRLPLQGILPNGAPLYDWSTLVALEPALHWPSFTGGDGRKTVARVWPGREIRDGASLYTIAAPDCAQPLKLPGIDGDGWWAGRNWRKKICRFDLATGQCRWAVGRRAPGVAERGQMYNPISLAGVAEDAVFAADAMAVVWVWDADGLYLGRLYNGPDDKKPDQDSMYVEMQGANVIRHLGRTWLMANDCGTSVHEVHLPKRQAVAGGTVAVSAAQAAQAVAWDPDGVTPGKKPVLEVHYLPAHKVDKAMAIDGDFDGREGWYGFSDGTKVEEAMVLLDGERLANVRALYDDKDLFLAYRVHAVHGPANAGTELPICPFVSGAYLDLCIGPDWGQPQRAEVRPGDVRVILAQIASAGSKPQPFQCGYWPVKPGGSGGQTITSPAASVRMDQIAEIPGLRMAWRLGGTDKDTGKVDYQVEIAIPLAALGLGDAKGRRVGFDTAIGVANAAGDRRERAGHWGGLSEAAVVDRPGSSRLLPENWGTLVFLPR
jgi:FlgD Ig-like domain